MKKSLAVLAAVVMLFAACGREGEPEAVSGVADSSPTPAATTAAGASATPKATSAAAATGAPAATSAPAGTSAPTQTAAPGKQALPKEGRYVYTFKGKGTDPTNPAAGQQSFDGERYDEISHSGNVITTESTTSESPGRTITKLRLSDTKLEMLSIKLETQAGTYDCTFSPPLLITRFPVKPETYPTQNFKGDGNACNGKLDITIERKETVKDATGRSHETWRAKVRTELKPENISIVQNETRWVSPDIGVEVRSEGKQDGSFKSGATTFKFSTESTSVLKSRP